MAAKEGDLVLDQETLQSLYKSEQESEAPDPTEFSEPAEPEEQPEVEAEFEAEDEPEDFEEPEKESLTDLAKRLGWKDPEDWKGDRTNLIEDPAEFLALQARTTAELKEQLTATRRELLEVSRKTQETSETYTKSRLDELDQARIKAFEQGDIRRHDDLLAQMREIEGRTRAAPEAPQPTGDQDPNFWEWYKGNSWYNKDQSRTTYADQVAAPQVVAEGLTPQTHGVEFYNRVTEKVNEYFGAPKRAGIRQPVVEDPARQPAATRKPQKNAKGFAQMPREAQDAFEYWVRKRVYKDTNRDRAEYAREYFANNQ